MSQKPKNKFLMTQSLLSAWEWGLKGDKWFDDFLNTLNRRPIKQNKAMLEGIRFENILNAVLSGAEIESTHEWYKPIMELYPVLCGSQQQAAIAKDVCINGIDFVLYGKLDFLKAGIIYDTKYSKTYRVGKYIESPQHPMYFALVPEAREFQYKICDGKYVYTEKYTPEETQSIETTIIGFMKFLDNHQLVDVYCENWRSKY
jgi:hypothetical protein